jgi:hypothetical protein
MELAPRPRSAARRAVLLSAAAAFGLFASPSSAQPAGSKSDEAEAARLFGEGREALTKKDNVTACARFRSSLALAARPNTIFRVAQCDEADGKIAAALSRWQQGLAMLPDGDERLKIARDRIAALDPKVPRVSIKLDGGAPEGSRVLIDGAAQTSAVFGAPIPLEIGAHSIVVEAPGRASRTSEVTLSESDRKEIRVAAGPAVDGGKGNQGGPTPPPPSSGGALRTAGFIAGAVGVAGLITAGVTGGLLLANDGTVKDHCNTMKVCDAQGWQAINDAGPLFTVNTISWIVGGAWAGAGVALLLSSRSGGGSAKATGLLAPTPLPGGGGVTLVGRF